MVVSAASSTLSADTHMDQTTWISTSRQAAHSMRALVHPTLILFVYLKCLIKPLLLLVLAQSCRVHGDPAATISRVSWLSCDWIQLHRVTTEGWWRADVWLNASITIRPDVCLKAAVKGPASPLVCRYNRTQWVLVVHWHHLKGLSQPEAFYCMTEIWADTIWFVPSFTHAHTCGIHNWAYWMWAERLNT